MRAGVFAVPQSTPVIPRYGKCMNLSSCYSTNFQLTFQLNTFRGPSLSRGIGAALQAKDSLCLDSVLALRRLLFRLLRRVNSEEEWYHSPQAWTPHRCVSADWL